MIISSNKDTLSQAILSNELKDGDKVVVITSRIAERDVREILEDIKSVCEIGEKIKVVDGNFYEMIADIALELKKYKESETKVVVGKDIVGLAAIFALFFAPSINVEFDGFEIPRDVFKFPEALALGKTKLKVLEAVLEDAKEVKKIAEKIGIDVTVVRRHVLKLEELGLVRITKRKPMIIEISDFGKSLLKLR